MIRSGKFESLQRAVGWCEAAAELLSKSPLSFLSMSGLLHAACFEPLGRTERVLTLQGGVLMDTHERVLLRSNANQSGNVEAAMAFISLEIGVRR